MKFIGVFHEASHRLIPPSLIQIKSNHSSRIAMWGDFSQPHVQDVRIAKTLNEV